MNLFHDTAPAVPVPPRRPGMAREHAKPLALETMHRIQSGALPARLLGYYQRAAAGQLPDSKGRLWHGLTDFEAAAWLGKERSDINGARNRLMDLGLVRSLHTRQCRHRPKGPVNAYGLASYNGPLP